MIVTPMFFFLARKPVTGEASASGAKKNSNKKK